MRTFAGHHTRTRLDCRAADGTLQQATTLYACAASATRPFQAESPRSVKIQIGNKIYDTGSASSLAGHRTSSTHQELWRTPEGDFFLLVHQIYVDGRKLGPHDTWVDLRTRPHCSSRLQCRRGIRPLKRREALEWCIKTQIPETFRGLLLESIPL